jgi:hypothetical protein
MSAQSAEFRDQHDVIHLGGETTVVVPMEEYRRLRAPAPAGRTMNFAHRLS